MTKHRRTIQDVYAAFAKGDIPTVLGALAPDARWTEAEGFPYAGTYVGPDAVLEGVFMRIGTEWDGFAAVPERLVAEGDTVVAIGEYSGTYKATGKRFAAPFVHVWDFEGDRVARFTQHTDTVVVGRALS
ncbi:MAG: nuclear transport factor 2 family protein [Planctomycetota bacterium]